MEERVSKILLEFYLHYFWKRFRKAALCCTAGYVVLILIFDPWFAVSTFIVFIMLHQTLRLWCLKKILRRAKEGAEYFNNVLKDDSERETIKSLLNFMEKWSGDPKSKIAEYIMEEAVVLRQRSDRIACWGLIEDLRAYLGERKPR